MGMSYNIYRQATSTGVYDNRDFELIYSNCKETSYLDIGSQPDAPIEKFPPEVTITEFSPPSKLRVYNKTHITQLKTARKNKNWIRIIIYQKGTSEIASFHLDRLAQLLKDMIPPELGYTVILCNDNYSKILI